MNASETELRNIQNELSAIIRELNGISTDVRHAASGIGIDKCADSIDSVISGCRSIQTRLSVATIAKGPLTIL